jgi:adenosylcobinamide-GDP ribazoletransferase
VSATTLLRRLTLAFAFLTRLPVPSAASDEVDVGRSVAFFPLVGLVLGAILAASASLLAGRLPSSVLAVLLVALHATLSGGLHLDGVADTFDALGAAGADRARRLEILRDSRIGAHGAAALVLVLLLKVTALHALLASGRVAALVAFPVVGRCSAVLLIALFPYARSSGLGAAFHAHVRARDALAASVVAALAVLVPGGSAWLAAVLSAVLALAFAGFVARRFGGVTGDVCGAAIELSEVAFLILSLRSS